jgi:hypothetical protein
MTPHTQVTPRGGIFHLWHLGGAEAVSLHDDRQASPRREAPKIAADPETVAAVAQMAGRTTQQTFDL